MYILFGTHALSQLQTHLPNLTANGLYSLGCKSIRVS